MKIVFPVLSLETGGGARFIYQLANGLVDKGHDVTVVMANEGLMVWPLRAKFVRAESLTPESIPEADFILPNFWPTVFPAWESQKGKVVRLSLGYEPLWVSNQEKAKESYTIGAPIMSISNWHRQLLLEHLGLDSVVIHAGVDSRIFRPRTKLSELTGRKRVFYILRARAAGYFWKGNDEFLAACQAILPSIPDLDVQVVTPEGVIDPNLPGLFSVNHATDDHQMARLYGEADIFVFCSHFEAFGLPPLEAMACGTAVITSDCGGNRDYAQHRQNCLVVPPGDVQQLSSAMLELLQNDGTRNTLAAAGNSFAQSWTWERTAEQVEQFLLSL